MSIKKPRRKTAPKPTAGSLVKDVAEAALAQKAEKVLILEVTKLLDYTDHFVIASGRSTRQAQAIAEHIQRAIYARGGKIFGVEGEEEGNWILIDGGSVIAHVFYQPVREFYELEKLWGDAPRTEVRDEPA